MESSGQQDFVKYIHIDITTYNGSTTESWLIIILITCTALKKHHLSWKHVKCSIKHIYWSSTKIWMLYFRFMFLMYGISSFQSEHWLNTSIPSYHLPQTCYMLTWCLRQVLKKRWEVILWSIKLQQSLSFATQCPFPWSWTLRETKQDAERKKKEK